MSDIRSGDFKYYQTQIDKDKSYHGDYYINRIEPDIILAYYEGSRQLNNIGTNRNENDSIQQQGSEDGEVSRVTLNKIFTATNTVSVTLYPNNPGFVCTERREQDAVNAKVAESAMNYYFQEMNAVEVNQQAIINAWLFGFGCVKQGWRTVFRKKSSVSMSDKDTLNKLPNTLARLGITKEQPGDVNVEVRDDDEYIAFEEPFLQVVENKDIYLDRTQPFGKGKRITQRLTRSLYDLRKSGLYELTPDFMGKFGVKKDQREVMLTVYETWVQLTDGWHILTSVDGWREPIRWDKSPYMSEGHPFTLLRLNLEPEVTYPISHMKAGQRIHRELDYILTLQLQHIRKHRSMDLFYDKALDPSTRQSIKRNEIGGYGFTSKPLVEGVYQHVGGNTIPKDLFNMQDILINNLQEILTISGARIEASSGKETATENKITEFGNQLRTQTMQDQVNLFIKKQGKKLLQDIKQFATSPVLLKITGLDLQDPQSGQTVKEKWVEFATEDNPSELKDAIQGDYDIEIDVINIARRDPVLIKSEMENMFGLLANPLVLQLLAGEGTQFDLTEFLKDLFSNLQTIPNASKYFKQDQQQPPQQEQQEQEKPIELGENIVKTTQDDGMGTKVEQTQKEKIFA